MLPDIIVCERCDADQLVKLANQAHDWQRVNMRTRCGHRLCYGCFETIVGRDGFNCPWCTYEYENDTRSDEVQEREPHVWGLALRCIDCGGDMLAHADDGRCDECWAAHKMDADAIEDADCCLFCGPGPHLMSCEQFDAGDHEAVVQSILAESDAVCEGCGADPRTRFTFHGDEEDQAGRDEVYQQWYMALDLTSPNEITADVLCPTCLLAERFTLPQVSR
jgi:hypothetical protein